MATESVEAIPPKKKSLYDILDLMRQRDESMFDFSPDEMEITGEELRTKVDDFKYIEDQYKLRAEWAREQAKEFAAIAASCDLNIKGLKRRVGTLMQQYGFDSLPGQKFQMRRTESETIVIKDTFKPDAEIYRRYADANFVKRSYSWDKKAFDDAYESGKYPELKEVANVDKRPSMTITIKKGIK